jgi:hypothetical protein
MSDSFELRLKGGAFLKGFKAGNGLWFLTIQRPDGTASRYSITSGRLFEALLALGMPVNDARRIAEPDMEE